MWIKLSIIYDKKLAINKFILTQKFWMDLNDMIYVAKVQNMMA